MRPATLAEAIERIVDGTPQDKALPEFLDTFYLAPTAEQPAGGDCRAPGADGRPSVWTRLSVRRPNIWRGSINCRRSPSGSSSRIDFSIALGTSSQLDDPGMREYLTFASPAEFRSRNIFTEERPLRRARAKVA